MGNPVNSNDFINWVGIELANLDKKEYKLQNTRDFINKIVQLREDYSPEEITEISQQLENAHHIGKLGDFQIPYDRDEYDVIEEIIATIEGLL